MWYECRCHGENSTDRPTLIHSYGKLLSPEGLQIIKAFTTLNTHASHPLAACMCVCHIRLYLWTYCMFRLFTLRICQISLPSLMWQLNWLNFSVLLFWLEITISMKRTDSRHTECTCLVSIKHAYEYVYHDKSPGCCARVYPDVPHVYSLLPQISFIELDPSLSFSILVVPVQIPEVSFFPSPLF